MTSGFLLFAFRGQLKELRSSGSSPLKDLEKPIQLQTTIDEIDAVPHLIWNRQRYLRRFKDPNCEQSREYHLLEAFVKKIPWAS